LPVPQTILWISLGAILGANLRFGLAQYVSRLTAGFPYGTLLVNFTGSFVLGFFFAWTTDRLISDSRWRLFVAVGFCGGYTTFSSFAYESFALIEQGRWLTSVAYIVATNLLCLVAVVAGAALSRAL
jgi:fluoride exporter